MFRFYLCNCKSGERFILWFKLKLLCLTVGALLELKQSQQDIVLDLRSHSVKFHFKMNCGAGKRVLFPIPAFLLALLLIGIDADTICSYRAMWPWWSWKNFSWHLSMNFWLSSGLHGSDSYGRQLAGHMTNVKKKAFPRPVYFFRLRRPSQALWGHLDAYRAHFLLPSPHAG